MTDTPFQSPPLPDQVGGVLFVHFSTHETWDRVLCRLLLERRNNWVQPLSLRSVVVSEYCSPLLVTLELSVSLSTTGQTVSRATQALLKNLDACLKPSGIEETQVVWQIPLPADLKPL